MRITIEVSGFYDWAPVPPGTAITEEDVKDLKVKKMADGSWNMKISEERETEHYVGMHEQSICAYMAAKEKNGVEISREEAIAFFLREATKLQLAPSHMKKIFVDDGAPNEEIYRQALTNAGVSEPVFSAALERYLDDSGLEEYLNQAFKTKSFKERKKAEKNKNG